MKKMIALFDSLIEQLWNKLGLGMRSKLITIFLIVKVIPLILLTFIAWRQFIILGDALKENAVEDSVAALNDSAVDNIERMTTDLADRIATFLYSRDADILYLANINPSEEEYLAFIENNKRRVIKKGAWELAPDGLSWVSATEKTSPSERSGQSTNNENNDMDGFHYRESDNFEYESIPLYDEITFVDLEGNERVKFVASSSRKSSYPLDPAKKNVSLKENTYVKAETYFAKLSDLEPGEIYVSDVIGAYVGTNYIGMYTPEVLAEASEKQDREIPFDPEAQAYAGMENPNGQRFEGIVRWASPVVGPQGEKIGYVTLALNHDHLMEFVDHLTPMNERYTELPSAYEGNYAFIWDYQCRNICHPRHHSIVGYDPETGDPQIPWLETSIYDAWQVSGMPKWTDFIIDWPLFDSQSREKKPSPILTQQGLVGLDGRYLNNAPQCTGWMDLTADGGSGSFYILWSGLYKLTTAAAIPYYTGQYAPSEANDYSKRGFGIVTIGAGLEDFTRPAREMEIGLSSTIEDNLTDTFTKLVTTTIILIFLVVLIAVWMASFLTNNITKLIQGISRFRSGERQFRFRAPVKDEFGTLADSFDDMADRIVMEQLKLEEAVNDANRANEHKGEFLARMSHEIRTPMNAIIGVTNIVLKKLDDPEIKAKAGEIDEVNQYVQQIESSSQHLLGLLNDILDLSKIEAGKIELAEEIVDLPNLLQFAANIIQPRCDEKNIVFQTHFDSFSPAFFFSDPLRLRQVLINLLGNAAKFTPENGTVEFHVKKKAEQNDQTQIEFIVQDTGIGIPAEILSTIFQPFEQGGAQISRQYGGTGLGLAISRHIVQLFGGEITIESRTEDDESGPHGSRFSFVIWLREAGDDSLDEEPFDEVEGKFIGKRMLLVDDVELNRMIVVSMLEDTGLEIDEADDGHVAVEKFRAAPENTYDIILMDVQMPTMDGYQAAAAIRELERPDGKSVPIITLTANAFKDDIDKAMKHGMNAHLAKPIEIDKLLKVLLRYLLTK